MASINDREKRFCDLYLGPCKFNGTQAAIKAGYAKKSARITASKLLTKANVQIYLQSKGQKIENKLDLDVSAERTLREIGRVAFQDARLFFKEDGSLIPIHELSDDAAAVLAGFEIEEINIKDVKIGELKKIKRFDKVKALEMLAKYHKMFEDNDGKINLNVTIKGGKHAHGQH